MATVRADQVDPDDTNDFDGVSVTIVATPDLEVRKMDLGPFVMGSTGYYRLMGYPLDSGNPNILWLGSRGLGVPVGDDRSIRRWVHGDCLLHKAVEEFSPAA